MRVSNAMIGVALFRLLSEGRPYFRSLSPIRIHVIAHREASHPQFSGEAVLIAFRNIDIFLFGGIKIKTTLLMLT